MESEARTCLSVMKTLLLLFTLHAALAVQQLAAMADEPSPAQSFRAGVAVRVVTPDPLLPVSLVVM